MKATLLEARSIAKRFGGVNALNERLLRCGGGHGRRQAALRARRGRDVGWADWLARMKSRTCG